MKYNKINLPGKSTSTPDGPRVPLSTQSCGHSTQVSKYRKLGPQWKSASEPQPHTEATTECTDPRQILPGRTCRGGLELLKMLLEIGSNPAVPSKASSLWWTKKKAA